MKCAFFKISSGLVVRTGSKQFCSGSVQFQKKSVSSVLGSQKMGGELDSTELWQH